MTRLIIYHGSKNIIEKPYYHGGKLQNDYGYGFYCTESLELAKEWASNNKETNGYANKYSIDLDGLKILDLSNEKYSILNWMAILLKFRTFDLSNEMSIKAKEYLLNNFYIDVNDYDIVIGYRADDSYFSFAKDFLNNTISVQKLKKAMELGKLGKQVVIISELAFAELKFEGTEEVESLEYYEKRKSRDIEAKEQYLKNTRNSTSLIDDIFILDIIRRGFKNGDSSI